MDKLVAIVTNEAKNVRHDDDDIVDRLHHRYTVLILVVFTVFLGMAQYTGSPITCWVDKEFTSSQTKFVNSYCWVKNTYFLPVEHWVRPPKRSRQKREILYYQWIPFILLSQAALFYAPHAIWRALNSKSGVDSDNILEVADRYNNAVSDERRAKILTLITNQLDRFVTNPSSNRSCSFSISKILSKLCCCICGKRFGNYLVVLYIVTKFLYIANVFLQLFLLNRILKTAYHHYGLEAIRKAGDKEDFDNNPIFPKVTMCDFSIRRLGNVHNWTVQCLLPINLYTERVYMFLWFWMVFVLGLSCLSLLVYILRAMISVDRLCWIRNHLKEHSRMKTSVDQTLTKDFVYFYLKQDGVFILRMIAHNTNKITVGEIICSIWDSWRDRRADLNLLDSQTYGNKSTLPLLRKTQVPSKRDSAHRHLSKEPSAPILDEVDNGRHL